MNTPVLTSILIIIVPVLVKKISIKEVRMMRKYDAVVVGAGNGGLTAACKLAKAKKKVLMIERHNIQGGLAASFRRGRFEFETALHEICDLGDPGDYGDTGKLLFEEIGIKVPMIKIPDAYRMIVRGNDGEIIDATMPTGRQAYIDKMEEYAPGSRASMEGIFALVDEYNAAMAYMSSPGVDKNPNVLMQKFPNYITCAAQPVNKILDALHMPEKARAIFSSYWGYLAVDCDRLPTFHYFSMVDKYLQRSPWIPVATSHQITTALVERFREFGGEIWLNCTASQILFDDSGRIRGVSTSAGEVETRHIIWNGNPSIALANVIPEQYIPERALKLANARKFSARMYVLYLGLNKSCEELGIKDYCIFLPSAVDSVEDFNNGKTIATNSGCVAVCYSVVNPQASPEGTTILTMCAQYAEDDWGNVELEDYVRVKNAKAEELINSFEAKTGITIRPYIEEFSVATPWTMSRYAAVPEGAAYGYDSGGWDNLIARSGMLEQDNDIPGLWFTGASGPRGDGYNSTWLTGDRIAGLTLRDMMVEGE